jgi:hypothetical protein
VAAKAGPRRERLKLLVNSMVPAEFRGQRPAGSFPQPVEPWFRDLRLAFPWALTTAPANLEERVLKAVLPLHPRRPLVPAPVLRLARREPAFS